MSVLTPKRAFFLAAAVVLTASAYANNPSPRSGARMAFAEKEGVGVLFGGRGASDHATQLVHDTNETWYWNGTRFVQRFPLDRPAARNSHSMVYDTKRQRIVLFGGRHEATVFQGDITVFNDTWIYQNENWVQLAPASAPPARHTAGMTYDIVNDRVILFGGTIVDAAGDQKPIYDTWEFDGTTWAQVGASGQPTVAKPVLAYDAERKQTIMMGIDPTTIAPVMYGYDATAKTWTKLTPTTLPTCTNEGSMVYQPSNKKLFWMGGICTTNTNPLEEVFEWDGSNWTKLTTTNALVRAYAQAVTYDTERQNVVVFGGSSLGSTEPSSDVQTFARDTWRFPRQTVRPFPRSLATFQTDPVTGNIWLYGGLFENGAVFISDFWAYHGQQWAPITVDGGPGSCTTPLSAYDTDRARLVVVCVGDTVAEWDGAAFAWKSPAPTKVPDQRRFANIVYDKKLKKTVMFGGYGINGNYFNQTWTWDGTVWTQIKTKDSEAPNHRGLMAMWYDPLLEKTVVYGGLGRPNVNQNITRYSDMWAFDGTKWAKLNVATTPGQRFGAQVAVDPDTGKVLLFGGLLTETANGKDVALAYVNDTWIWDGKTTTWTKLEPARSPDARENGMMSYDPATRQIVLFGGFSAGFYHSDLWSWNGQTWTPIVDQATRRRSAGGTPVPAPVPSTHD